MVGHGRGAFNGETEAARVRSAVTEAMAALDYEVTTDALVEAVRYLFNPVVLIGLTDVPGRPLRLDRLIVDDEQQAALRDALDFDWMQPLLGPKTPNGTAIVGPELGGATQLAAAMTTGNGVYSYVVIAGEFHDVEVERQRLADFASETGESFGAIVKGKKRAADLAVVRERERLSRDLHDSLSQSLWSLSMLSETATAMIEPTDPLRDMIGQIAELSLTSQAEMRSLLINLRSVDSTQETLAGALERAAAKFREANDLEVIVSVADADVDPRTTEALRRITEEALNNVARHSNASSVLVLFGALPVQSLRIFDDGDGFDTKPREGHLGLRAMEEHADSIGFDFAIESEAGRGTIITAAADQSKVPAYLPDLASGRPARISRLLVPLLVGLVCLAGALGAFAFSSAHQARADRAQSEIDNLLILDQRISFTRVRTDELTVRLLQRVGAASTEDVVQAAVDSELVRAEARRLVRPLISQEGSVGQRARSLAEEVREPIVFDQMDMLVMVTASGESDPAVPTNPQLVERELDVTALPELARLEEIIPLKLFEYLAAVRLANPAELDETVESDPLAAFLDLTAEVADVTDGYLGPDPLTPLSQGFIPSASAETQHPEVFAQLNEILIDSALLEVDQRSTEGGNAVLPLPIEDFVARSNRARTDFRDVIDAEIAQAAEGYTAVGEGEQRQASAFRLGAFVALLAGGVALARAAVVAAALRRRRRSQPANIVTKIRGRSSVDSHVSALLADPRFEYHALVKLDIDRTGFINDVHGVAFGDRVIELVGNALAAVTSRSPGLSGSMARTGGDEFVASFHSEEPLEVGAIVGALNRIQSTTVSASDGTFVRLNFSYGLETAEGSPDFQSLMAAAELDLYADRGQLNS